jgi:hypothetical protein
MADGKAHTISFPSFKRTRTWGTRFFLYLAVPVLAWVGVVAVTVAARTDDTTFLHVAVDQALVTGEWLAHRGHDLVTGVSDIIRVLWRAVEGIGE